MRAIITIVLLTTAFTLGCKEKHDPCSGMNFDPIALPMTFGVTSDGSMLGKVTMDAEQNVTFTAEPKADPERLARFETSFANHAAADAVTYEYSDSDGEGTHFSCGGSTKKGTPEYPAAFKMALYSDYVEIVDDPK